MLVTNVNDYDEFDSITGEDDKDVCKWQWFSPLILWNLFFHLTFLSIIELSEFLLD